MAKSCDKPLRVPFVGWEGLAYGSMEGSRYSGVGENTVAYLVFHAEFTYQALKLVALHALCTEMLLPFP